MVYLVGKVYHRPYW